MTIKLITRHSQEVLIDNSKMYIIKRMLRLFFAFYALLSILIIVLDPTLFQALMILGPILLIVVPLIIWYYRERKTSEMIVTIDEPSKKLEYKGGVYNYMRLKALAVRINPSGNVFQYKVIAVPLEDSEKPFSFAVIPSAYEQLRFHVGIELI